MATVTEISGIFSRYGVDPSLHADGSYEDPTARLARLAASGRSLEDIEAAVRGIASARGIGTFATSTTQYNGVPGNAELWLYEPTGWYFLVYFVPNSNTPILYTTSPQEAQALVGPDRAITPTRIIRSSTELKATGGIGFGLRRQLINDTADPFATWVSQVEAQAEVRPWLRDREVLALIAQAQLEGRPITEADFQRTDWWQTRTEAQRRWALLTEADPATAAQLRADQELVLANMFRQAGASNVPAHVISQMASQYLSGLWTQNYLVSQVRAISDPASGIAIDPILGGARGGDTTRGREIEVAEMFSRWLGPTYGQDQGAIRSWAGRLRNDPDAEADLIDHLRRQRLALFPEYDNPDLTYDDVVGPWRGFWSQQWGQPADETDPLFTQVVRTQDATKAAAIMREQGILRGIKKVQNDLVSFGSEVAGPQVRTLG